MQTRIEDSVLVSNYIQGEEKALEVLIKRHNQRISSFIYSKVLDRDVTEDIFQDTFIKVIKTLRKQNINYPILVLTARDSWQDKVAGLDAGADDYLTKPFQNEELIARLNALIRRSAGKTNPVLTNGVLTVNTTNFQVCVNDNVINLSSSEYKLLAFLMMHKGEVKSKTVLTEHIYDQDFDLDSNVIEVFIRRLRKKLDPDGQYDFIETHRGLGYQLKIMPE